MVKKTRNPLQILGEQRNYNRGLGLGLAVWGVIHIISFHPIWMAPTYEKIEIEQLFATEVLTKETANLLFLQTGLGVSALEELRRRDDGLSVALAAQEAVFGSYFLVCQPVVEGLTGEDHLADEAGNSMLAPVFVEVLPGDVLVTLSPHSLGWHHGHAGLVVEGGMVLESFSLGVDSGLAPLESWRRYSQYALLRVKNATDEQCAQVVSVGEELLLATRYDLTVGLWGEKFADAQGQNFGTQCAYLPWYAWQSVGVDIDGNGGRLVTPSDLLQSDEVEIVQMFGFPLEQYQ